MNTANLEDRSLPRESEADRVGPAGEGKDIAVPRGRIYDDLTQTVGGTPLVRLSRLTAAYDLSCEIGHRFEGWYSSSSIRFPRSKTA